MYDYFAYDHPVFRPPSEARSLILQPTIGCSQNQCRFCGMYKTKRFRQRPLTEVVADIDAIPLSHRGWVQRVFLGDGDGLSYDQANLEALLEVLIARFPNLNRVGAYASPRSLSGKSVDELQRLRERKLRILYFGLESGDADTLTLANKGYDPATMLQLCRNAQDAQMKLSVTAILGLAGKERSREHALATADWITQLSPAYFSLLTLFQRHNDAFFTRITPLSHGGILAEALLILEHLAPQRTILRSNHVSNFLNLAGSYPKDRQRLIDETRQLLELARRQPWFEQVPDYRESYY
ncbi:MAG: radical SAM protein [Desulfuromonadaceae bacterium]|nr:radical SAM protein [Desulfuromonadaceae bacterium]